MVGLDGAGKGTYIEMLLQDFQKREVSVKLCYLGYAAYRLLPLRYIVTLMKKHRNHPLYKFLFLAYLILLPFEFLVKRGLGTYEVLITDRHPIYEPVFHYGFFTIYNRFIEKLCPSPDIVIYLTGDAEALWKRKKEHEYDHYVHRRALLDKLIKLHAKKNITIEVDTVGDMSDVFRKIQSEISNHL
jgi:thymidylate kinase